MPCLPTQLLDLPPRCRTVGMFLRSSSARCPSRNLCCKYCLWFLKILGCVSCLDPTCSRSKWPSAILTFSFWLLTFIVSIKERTCLWLCDQLFPGLDYPEHETWWWARLCWDKLRISPCQWMKQTPCSRAFNLEELWNCNMDMAFSCVRDSNLANKGIFAG